MAGPRRWETAAYWLLYVVALGAALWHWAHDNPVLAVLCLVAVVVSIRLITRSARRKDPVGTSGT